MLVAPINYDIQLLKDIAEQIAEWELTPEQLRNLCADIPGEVGAIMEAANERAWEQMQENGGPDDNAYRRDMINAGRGNLLK